MHHIKKVSLNNGRVRQFLAAIIANMAMLSYGVSIGWPSPIIPQLRSSNPPVGDTPMNEEQISWISGLVGIGGLLTIPFCGILTECLGRKRFALLTGLPHIISWLLIIFGQSQICMFTARFIAGVAGAMTIFIVPLYVSEIASEDIRGALCSLLALAANIGILFAYVTGAFLSYRLFASISLLFSLAFVVNFALMPETPVYLVRRNKQLQARKSLMFLRGNNQALVEEELSRLQTEVNASNNSSKSIGLISLLKDRATCKGLIISFGLLGGQQLSGIFAMITYAETIFKRAGSSVSSSTASIIIALILVFSAYLSTMLMERAGRRLLTLVSCIGMAISHTVVGLFFYLQQNNHDVSSISWLPMAALSTYIVTYSLGLGPVPFVVTSEVFRLDVSSLAVTLCHIFYWLICFAAIKTFSMFTELLGDDGCFFMLAAFCAACFVFSYCLLPETKGRKREDIVNELAGICEPFPEKIHDINK